MEALAEKPRISMYWIKFLLYSVNLIFVLGGILIILMTGDTYEIYQKFTYFLDFRYLSLAIFLITVAVLIFIMAFLGCYGAFKESTCMVFSFASILSTVLILEFAALVTAYALKEDIDNFLSRKMEDTMKQYEENTEAREAIDSLQTNLKCCGYNKPEQWKKIVKCILKLPIINGSLYLISPCYEMNYPNSCYESGNSEDSSTTLFSQGCREKLVNLVNDNASSLILGASIIALVQLAGIIFACMLGRLIRKYKIDRRMRMCQRQTTKQNIYVPFEKINPTTTSPTVYM